MREWHPDEVDLAESGGAGGDLADHLDWCSRCRGLAADYEWLEDEIAAALAGGAEEAPVGRPRWERVKARLKVPRRGLPGGQLLAVGGAVAMTCMMLVAPSIVAGRPGGRRPGRPGRMGARLPVSAPVDDAYPYLGETLSGSLTEIVTEPAVRMTRSSASSGHRTVSLPFVPPPEPPEPEV
jgi:hypothetical protein